MAYAAFRKEISPPATDGTSANPPDPYEEPMIAEGSDMQLSDWQAWEAKIGFRPAKGGNWLFFSGWPPEAMSLGLFQNGLNRKLIDRTWPHFNYSYLGPLMAWHHVFTDLDLRKVFPVADKYQYKPTAYASLRFSQCAEGRVHLVLPVGRPLSQPYERSKDSFLFDFELWELTKPNGRVDEILLYRYGDSSYTPEVIWKRGDRQMGNKPSFDKASNYPLIHKDELSAEN